MDFGVSVNWDFAAFWVSPPPFRFSAPHSSVRRSQFSGRRFRVANLHLFCSSRSPIFSHLSPPWSSFGQFVRFRCVISLFLHFPARLVNYFGVVSFWLCAPPPFNWCANVNASFLAKMYDSTAYMHFSLWWSHLASIFVTRFWWHTCHYLIWKRSNVESRKFRLRSF